LKWEIIFVTESGNIFKIEIMKKSILFLAALSLGITSYAQDRNVTSARMALNQKSYDDAKIDIDRAIEDPSTKDKPKTWSTRGQIYFEMQTEPTGKYKASNPYREAAKSYMKVVELKSDYDKDYADRVLLSCAAMYLNDAINAYNDRKWDEASDLANGIITIHNLEGGKRFSSIKTFDTLAANAAYIRANSFYANGKYDEALTAFNIVKNGHAMNSADVYLRMAEIYNKQGKDADATAIIAEGRKEFPNDASLRNAELNSYIKSGKTSDLTKKLEEAVAQDPGNAQLQYNLATVYSNMANATPKPSNYTELMGKAEGSFKKAIAADPDNAGYNYNLGAMYFNEAQDINTNMNSLGTSAADQKKYDEMKKDRDDYLAKAAPYMEKAYGGLHIKAASLKGEDRNTYHDSMLALKQIYAIQGKTDKSSEMKKEIESFK
jgi:predicted Zn-dependent protease